jgi:hypothetical protein
VRTMQRASSSHLGRSPLSRWICRRVFARYSMMSPLSHKKVWDGSSFETPSKVKRSLRRTLRYFDPFISREPSGALAALVFLQPPRCLLTAYDTCCAIGGLGRMCEQIPYAAGIVRRQNSVCCPLDRESVPAILGFIAESL